MPIYEYYCNKCDKDFEKLVFRGEEEQVRCPHCDGGKVGRRMSATSFISGSGLSSCGTEALKGTN